ncbi:hypothetical protein A1O3_07300 [Capronia epimyces CBS 606.96]|uniref:Uncharacterized protein n=1 Tax=Capronia epimyces CBS 606.96 TaxID=1182542 RepID=W9XKG6_9EURO|nr:uncharacterized protein A1O3_07300 [Capronia epimyces CBS 606.96]EXJ81012.1 hypothetical protein A1O3_07300 [Capronia epimyces CBS 606.96]
MGSFDTSPRASKRRRTGTYATRRTTLNTLPSDPTDDSKKNAQRPGKGPGRNPHVVSNVSTEREEDDEGITPSDTSAENRQLAPENKNAEAWVDRLPSYNEAKTRKRGIVTETNDGPIEEVLQLSDAAEANDEDKADEEEPPAKEDLAVGRPPRSSGRTRRPPPRFSSPQARIEVSSSRKQSAQKSPAKSKPAAISYGNDVGAEAESPQPKSILTPSRHGRDKKTGPRKSVAFDEDERRIGEHFGFKDIDRSTAKPTRKNKTTSTSKPSPPKKSSIENRAASARQTRLAETSSGSDEDGEANADGDDDDETTFDAAPDVSEVLSLPTAMEIHLGVQTEKSIEQEDNLHVKKIKSQILRQMTNHTLCPMSHLQPQYGALHSLLTATITAGESNSILLLGSRGSGKSLLLSHAISDLTKSHGDDFHVVRLNGFFQTDDKLALREIWRQLGREMAVPEDETGEVSSYADTMASLLSLLSHPEELVDPDSMRLDEDHEQQTNRAAKSVIFILDEFDLFTTHPRQTLLYNLFDIAQAKKAPIAVIGCSCRMDVVDCLEKRVKSRFSHRWLHIPGAKSLSAFEDAVASVLCVSVEGKEALGLTQEELEWRTRWNQTIQTRLLHSSTGQDLLKKTFYSTKSISDVLAAVYIPIAMLNVPPSSEETPVSDQQAPGIPGLGVSSAASLSPPSLLTLLPHLPTLHLTLLICAARLETIHSLPALNFTLVHSHYTELITRSRMQRSVLSSLTRGGAVTGAALRSWSKDTVRAAWEELVQWELLVPVSGLGGGASGGRLGDEGLGGDGVATRMFRVDVTLDEVAWAVKEKLGHVGTGEVLEKWCKEM